MLNYSLPIFKKQIVNKRNSSQIIDTLKAIIRRDEHVTAWGNVAVTLFLALVIYIDAVTKSEISF